MKPKRGSYWQLTPEGGVQPLQGHIPASTHFHSLLPLIPKRVEICMPGHPPLYFSSHLPSPKMLNPPEQWAHWCWQDVRIQAEELGAALPSALASPSRVSWAFGQLCAFPGELELSLKLWYLLWPQIPLDWEHQQDLVSDAWLLAVNLNESLTPEAFHSQRRGPLPLP